MRPFKSDVSRRLLIRNWKQKNHELSTNDDNSRNSSFVYLFIFLSATMRNPIQTSCSNSHTFTWSSASVQSIYLLYIACSPVPFKHCPPCTFSTLVCIQFIHICFSSISLINIASLPDHLNQMLVVIKATIDPGAHVAEWTDRFFGLHKLNRPPAAYVPGRKLRMQTRASVKLKIFDIQLITPSNSRSTATSWHVLTLLPPNSSKTRSMFDQHLISFISASRAQI
jgi:hypothetical protein